MTTTSTIIGNVTKDPELKYTGQGKAYLKFSVAVSKRVQKDGVWTDGPTSYFDITCWGTLAENTAASVYKGNRVIVTGRLEQSTWETSDGQKRTAVNLVADEVGAAMSRATVEIHRVSRDLTAPAAAVGIDDEEPF